MGLDFRLIVFPKNDNYQLSMKSVVIVLFGLLCLTNANDFELLQQMAEYDFGRAVIETIQIELNQGANSAQTVVTQLREMKEAAESELSDGAKQQQAEDAQCAKDIAEVQSYLQEALAQKADDERVIPFKEESLEDKQKQVSEKQVSENRSADKLKVLESNRQAEVKQFNAKRDEIEGLIKTLTEAKGTVSQLVSSQKFLQQPEQIQKKLEQHQDQLVQHQKNLFTTSNTHGYVNLVQVMLESALSSRVQDNKNLVVAILQVIDELVESLYSLQSVESKADGEKNQIFLMQKSRLQSELGGLEESISTLQAEKEKLTQNLLELENDIDAKVKVVEAKSQQLKDIEKTCQDQSHNNQKFIEQKNTELEIIVQCIEIFDTRFTDAIRSYIQKMHIKE